MLRAHASAHGPPKEGVMLLQLASIALDHTCKNVWLRGMGKTEYLWYCNRDKSGFQKNDPRTPVPYPSYQVLTSTWSCAACAPIARIAASEASAIDQSFDQPLRHHQFQSRPNPNWSNLGHDDQLPTAWTQAMTEGTYWPTIYYHFLHESVRMWEARVQGMIK